MGRLIAILVLLGVGVARAQPCDPCGLPDGRYRAITPPGWDGKTALKLLLFVHGWQGTADETVADGDVAGPAARHGYLLVAPDGLNKRWNFRGSNGSGRDDIRFLRDVVADAERRFPVDRRTVIASGFSIGASMVWDLACHAPAGFTAFLPLSGGFWAPLPTQCEGGPVNLRQTHGTADTTFPLGGRSIGTRMRQGDIHLGFGVWRAADACAETPDATRIEGDLTCSIWNACASGLNLQLCLHPGGHMIEGRHLETGLHWAEALPPR